ncbi:MAG: pro-sigmaK processing inhibitor BofA family protein [Firmicutes bacterium]|nr:pro-sigmaK processing inhibitor BofA family protein [Bacillota bacterium]
MGMEMGVLLTYAGAIILILVLGKLLLWPLKMIFKLAVNSIAGGLVILAINFIGANFGVMIPLNIINALVVGVLGIPGAVLLLIFNL